MAKTHMMLQKEEQIREIINNFDFEKVRKTMIALDWKYFDSDEVPSYGRLVNAATDLLGSCYSEAVRAYGRQMITMSSGGFKVIASRFDQDIYLSLSFEVSSICIGDLLPDEPEVSW